MKESTEKMPRYITVEMLKDREACSKQLKLFEDTFGSSAKLNEANLRKAYEVGLSIRFLYWNFDYFYSNSRVKELRAKFAGRLDTELAEDYLDTFITFLQEMEAHTNEK